jgi:hypothetical protein
MALAGIAGVGRPVPGRSHDGPSVECTQVARGYDALVRKAQALSHTTTVPGATDSAVLDIHPRPGAAASPERCLWPPASGMWSSISSLLATWRSDGTLERLRGPALRQQWWLIRTAGTQRRSVLGVPRLAALLVVAVLNPPALTLPGCSPVFREPAALGGLVREAGGVTLAIRTSGGSARIPVSVLQPRANYRPAVAPSACWPADRVEVVVVVFRTQARRSVVFGVATDDRSPPHTRHLT